MMKKIIIIGSMDLGSTVAKAIHHKFHEDVVIVNNLEAKNIVNEVFKPEPILLHLTYRENTDIQISEIPRNKYFDKPKNNFKK